LVAFADGLKTNPAALVTIEGHTDSVGSEASNLSLSKDRALSTRDYLAANGVAIGRITTNGYGETRPIADNATAAGKAQNRRVEIFMAEPAPKQ